MCHWHSVDSESHVRLNLLRVEHNYRVVLQGRCRDRHVVLIQARVEEGEVEAWRFNELRVEHAVVRRRFHRDSDGLRLRQRSQVLVVVKVEFLPVLSVLLDRTRGQPVSVHNTRDGIRINDFAVSGVGCVARVCVPNVVVLRDRQLLVLECCGSDRHRWVARVPQFQDERATLDLARSGCSARE